MASVVYYALVGLDNLGTFAVVIAYAAFGAITLAILKNTKSDEPCYVNLNLSGLAASFAVAAGMVGVALAFGALFNMSVFGGDSLVPTSFIQSITGHSGLSALPLATIELPTSYVTTMLSDLLFNFLIIAFVEELLKLGSISALRDSLGPLAKREKKLHKIVLYLLLTGFCFVEPVFLWAMWHGLQTYSSDWLLIIPAFINGLLLLVLIFKRSVHTIKFGIIAAIIAHGAYDSYITIAGYLSGSVSTAGLPLFPVNWSFADIFIFVLLGLSIVCLAIPIALSKDN
jgi:hypothetical protein